MPVEKQGLIDEIQSKQEDIQKIEESGTLDEVYKEYTEKLTEATVATRKSIESAEVDSTL